MINWIKVEDQKPKVSRQGRYGSEWISEDVLVWNGKTRMMARYTDTGYWVSPIWVTVSFGVHERYCDITHWMELPESPNK